MHAPVRQAGAAACSRFASSTLQRVCIAHRQALLESRAARSHGSTKASKSRFYTAIASDPNSLAENDHVYSVQYTQAADGCAKPAHSPQFVSRQWQQRRAIHSSILDLDPFLPAELRSGTLLEKAAGFKGIRDPKFLASIVNKIDKHFKHGVFTCLSQDQKRWSAYIYLAEAFIRSLGTREVSLFPIQTSLWSDVHLPYSQMLTNEGKTIYDALPKISPISDRPLSPESKALDVQIDADFSNDEMHHRALGSLWQSLGLLTAKAADAEKDDATQLMSLVHQVLGILHSAGKMHPLIYQVDAHHVCERARKSPFLHLMSGRMMTAISDSSWKASEDRKVSRHTWMTEPFAKAEQERGTDLDPSVLSISPEAWLDLILWSCVLGDHIEAGSDILRSTISEGFSANWSTISWNELTNRHLGPQNEDEARQFRERYNSIAGTIEGYSKEPPVIDLPPKTVSREAVVAVVDSLIASRSLPESSAIPDERLLHDLLSQPWWRPDLNHRNVFAGRVLESTSTVSDIQLFLHSVGSASSILGEKRPVILDRSPQNRWEEHVGTAAGHIYHRLFDHAVDTGNLEEALLAFGQLQSWTDGKKRQSLNTFLDASLSSLEDRGESSTQEDILRRLEQQETSISPAVLARFLDLLTKHRLLDVGTWLLSSREIDGPTVSFEASRSSVFIPAMLRFATALQEFSLVEEAVGLLSHEDGSMTAEVAHAMLHTYIEFSRFPQVATILKHIHDDPADEVSADDIMVLVRQILRLESKRAPDQQRHRQTALTLLKRILSREYMRNDASDRRVQLAKLQELNLLSTMLVTLHGDIGEIAEAASLRAISSKYRDVTISTQAFNILLQGIVERQGPQLAKSLIERWCILPTDWRNEQQQSTQREILDHEFLPILWDKTRLGNIRADASPTTKVVVPDRFTIKLVLDAARQGPEVFSSSTLSHDHNFGDGRTGALQPIIKWEDAADLEAERERSTGLHFHKNSHSKGVSGQEQLQQHQDIVQWCEHILDKLPL